MTTLHKPIQGHSHVVFGWTFVRISLFFGKHENGGVREVELVDQQILHAFSIVNTSLELMPRVLIRDTAYQGSLPPVRRRRRPGRRSRRSMVVMVVVVVVVAGGGGGAWLSYARDGTAYDAADGFGSRRELQRRTAVGAIYEQEHGFFVFLVDCDRDLR